MLSFFQTLLSLHAGSFLDSNFRMRTLFLTLLFLLYMRSLFLTLLFTCRLFSWLYFSHAEFFPDSTFKHVYCFSWLYFLHVDCLPDSIFFLNILFRQIFILVFLGAKCIIKLNLYFYLYLLFNLFLVNEHYRLKIFQNNSILKKINDLF